MKKDLIRIAAAVITLIVVTLFFCHLSKEYNHGICPNCGIHYTEEKLIYDGKSMTDYYCENCGKEGRIYDWFK